LTNMNQIRIEDRTLYKFVFFKDDD
jgi:hypothetical protein